MNGTESTWRAVALDQFLIAVGKVMPTRATPARPSTPNTMRHAQCLGRSCAHPAQTNVAKPNKDAVKMTSLGYSTDNMRTP
ncbi:hypothetical protein ACFPRL_03615 [Pseudoclavibacter helvolus]